MATPIPKPPQGAPLESVRLGAGLTAILVLAYFGFIGLGAFAPALLAQPVHAGGTVTWAFAYGLGVIGLGVGLTGLYVLAANRAETRGKGA
ncbi:DUF485 domain-containing protein [uncultured Methylobacterium sp.]|uniref:DUF485 domain-containing protein n=1 Tax=uncultured Methylobacterium sp. TaxID=157278 RepID=UPI0035CC1FC8